jgi:hypothetical protein
MTLPASGQIGVSDISVEIGQASTYSTSLDFLNNLIVAGQRTSPPAMTNFYSKAYFQNNTQGNCSNGNCTSNCNCGNIQCNNCLIAGTVNCTNCDAQSWLQSNCNCACTYNCTTSQTSYNCNCACNCSKIICAKLYEFGLMDPNIWAADQKYGQWLRKNDRRLYRGYVRWARIVTAWMDGKGPDFMVWIKDDTKRSIAQKAAITDMAIKIGTPWSQHMAWLMNEVKNDNTMGRILMAIGTPISKLVSLLPRSKKKFADRKHSLITLYTMWILFYFSYYTSLSIVKMLNVADKIKQTKLFSIFKRV